MEITKVVKPFIRRGWPNTFCNIVYTINLGLQQLIDKIDYIDYENSLPMILIID